MNGLLKQLSNQSLTNVDDRGPEHKLWFVPRPALDQIVDKTAISEIADATDLPIDEEDRILAASLREGLKRAIYAKARITFAVSCYVKPHCLRHIRRLIGHGDEKGSKIDRHLPLSRSNLSDCGFDTHDADSFFKAQWHFIAPKIQLGDVAPTKFRQECILPFQAIEAEHLPPPETGAFGKVVRILVTPGHQIKPVFNGSLFRKQFKPEKGTSIAKDFMKELRNLAILSSARHENIVQLLFAYVQGESFNFIFPLASHGNLKQLFQGIVPSSWTAMEVVLALSGLASALVVMHQFTTANLHLIGCHRDLKPANILVDEKRLVLADFGLSRFVDGRERSTSTAPNVNDDFIAPEHSGKDFSLNRIGRSSDIWAFGCVTLMFLVYLLHGKEGVDQLQRQRRAEPWPQFAHHYFHNYDRANPGLEELFKQLDSDHLASTQGLLYLVKKMLALDKEERPKATTVDAHMRSLVIHLWSTIIEEEFDRACEGEYTHVKYERARLEGWRATIIKTNESRFPEFRRNYASASYSDFKILMEHLQELHKMLFGFNRGEFGQDRMAFLPVRSRIDHLWGTLDEEGRHSAVAYTEDSMLRTKRLEVLYELQEFLEQTSDKRAEGKAIVKRHVGYPSRKRQFYIDFTCLEPKPLSDNVAKTWVVTEASPRSDLTIAEETKSARWFQKDVAPSLYAEQISSRLREIVNLLSRSADTGLFKVLHCRGYYCYSRERRSGLLYELPRVKNVKLEKMFTLHEILDRHNSEGTRWFLGERFRLAHSLASAVYELHTVSWLHRNMSASNIVFFYEKEGDFINPESFYLIGFAQSRPENDLTYTDGPTSTGDKNEYYEHPEHLFERQEYQMQHDYYALGMLLLEIGLWKLLPDAVPDWTAIPDKGKTIAKEIVPQLGFSMGSCYRDAVLACLEGDWGEWAKQRRQKIPMLFRADVVERLGSSHCRAW